VNCATTVTTSRVPHQPSKHARNALATATLTRTPSETVTHRPLSRSACGVSTTLAARTVRIACRVTGAMPSPQRNATRVSALS